MKRLTIILPILLLTLSTLQAKAEVGFTLTVKK